MPEGQVDFSEFNPDLEKNLTVHVVAALSVISQICY